MELAATTEPSSTSSNNNLNEQQETVVNKNSNHDNANKIVNCTPLRIEFFECCVSRTQIRTAYRNELRIV